MNAYDVILKPVMSEKAYDGIAEKRYTFKVNRSANKIEIKQAVEQIFGVSVEKVNTVNVRGRLKRQGRTQGYTSKYKKAVVTLKKDSKAIEFFESLS
jgi:large subunit ribosomal protein L23